MQDLALAVVTNSSLEVCGIDHGLPCPTKAQTVGFCFKISVPYRPAGSRFSQKFYGFTQCAHQPSPQAIGWPPSYVSENPSPRLKPFSPTKFVDENRDRPEPPGTYHNQERRPLFLEHYRPARGCMEKNRLARTPSTLSGVEQREKT